MMDRDLFLAILSMDSYNRGYAQGVTGLLETGQLGNATLAPATAEQKAGWESAGFYALAYDVSGVGGFDPGETVIAYRGSDEIFGSDGDLQNGYGVALGGNPSMR
jgi:hypothetical protein